MVVDPVILTSARKHGVLDHDMLHAYRNPSRVFELDDLVMLIGADAAGRLLEIGLVSAEGVEFIVHAMPARSKFLR
ncbi:MAG TPA: hypothetical protein VM282_27430 [Acidimicrobiales bacterium]|nr:hypothetical protein [Acidimicrobiales bacterium]